MNSVHQAVLWQKDRLFIGRQKECDTIQRWLDTDPAPTLIAGVSGIAGIGKSTLLLKFLQMAQESGALTAWLDARALEPTPQAFLTALPAPFHGPEFAQRLEHQHALLAVDNFDDAYGIEPWLREVLLPMFPSQNLMVVAGSRHSVVPRWRVDPGWQRRTLDFSLHPFSLSEVRQWQNEAGPIPGAAESLYHETHGLPLTLALSLEAPGVNAAARLPALWDEPVADSPSRLAADVLALVLVAQWDFLQTILDRPVSTAEYHALGRLAFVRRTPEGLSLHDLVRHFWYEHLRTERPDYFAQLRGRVFREFLRLSRSGPQSREHFMSQQFFWLFRDMLGVSTRYADLQAVPDQLEVGPFRPEDRELLLAMAGSWQRESLPVSPTEASLFLNEVMTLFPELVRVLRRQESGRPVAFMASVWLTEASVALMAKYHAPFTGKLLKALEMSPHSLKEPDTTYHLTVCIDPSQEDYTRRELMGMVSRDAFGLMPGNRNLVMARTQGLQAFLQSFGYRRHPFSPGEGDAGSILYELDLRRTPFIKWILPVLAGLSSEALPRQSDITAAEVKEAYEHLYDVSFSLSDTSPFSAENGRIWRQVLREMLQPPFIPPLTKTDADLLDWVYGQRHTEPAAAVEKFAWSRASYYRHLRTALEHATEVAQRIL